MVACEEEEVCAVALRGIGDYIRLEKNCHGTGALTATEVT